MKRWYLFFLGFAVSVCAQRTPLKGTVWVNGFVSTDAFIQNATTEEEVKADENGTFQIMAQPDDLLLFYGEGIDFFRILVEDIHFEKGIEAKLTAKAITLDEVTIANFDVVKMGILSSPAKKYTPAERRYKRIASLDPTFGLGPGIGGVSFSLDPIMNKLNGGIRKYKRALDAERAEIARKRVYDRFDAEEIAKRLNIDEKQIDNMLRFAAEVPEFQDVAKAGTDSALLFTLSRYWVMYQEHMKE